MLHILPLLVSLSSHYSCADITRVIERSVRNSGAGIKITGIQITSSQMPDKPCCKRPKNSEQDSNSVRFVAEAKLRAIEKLTREAEAIIAKPNFSNSDFQLIRKYPLIHKWVQELKPSSIDRELNRILSKLSEAKSLKRELAILSANTPREESELRSAIEALIKSADSLIENVRSRLPMGVWF